MRYLTLLLPVFVVVACAGCGKETAAGPVTMKIYVDPAAWKGGENNDHILLETGVVEQDLIAIFGTNAFAVTVDGQPPAPLVDPPVDVIWCREDGEGDEDWAKHWNGSGWARAKAENEFIVVEKDLSIGVGLYAFGKQEADFCHVMARDHKLEKGIVSLTDGRYREAPKSRTTRADLSSELWCTPTVVAHIFAYTVAHEIGYHQVGGHTWEGSNDPVRMGCGYWWWIFEDPAGYIRNGTFPPWEDEQIEELQKRMGYRD
ncbi:MAG: hypothetical protein JW990_12680 [Thermoleophilia bacterium]|nr:hypothetical protein [Thermoleophilia bacterium]